MTEHSSERTKLEQTRSQRDRFEKKKDRLVQKSNINPMELLTSPSRGLDSLSVASKKAPKCDEDILWF